MLSIEDVNLKPQQANIVFLGMLIHAHKVKIVSMFLELHMLIFKHQILIYRETHFRQNTIFL